MANNTLDQVELVFRRATASDLTTIVELESSSYPSDEGATAAALYETQDVASAYFHVMENNTKQVVGFICGTRGHDASTAENITSHVPTGKVLAIHSVVIRPSYRRSGVATKLLRNYIQEMKKDQSLEMLVLLAKAHLLAFYVNVGFQVVGRSPMVHGRDSWYDLRLSLQTP
jgi:guanine nucleotide exchange factor